jgi:hypothetical protein
MVAGFQEERSGSSQSSQGLELAVMEFHIYYVLLIKEITGSAQIQEEPLHIVSPASFIDF